MITPQSNGGMLDAFYVHIRLLAEFLLRTTKGGDFGPADFGTTWEAPEGAAATRLDEVWDVASKYVVHFGGRRVPRRLAGDALELYSVFVDAFADAAPERTRGAGALIPDPESDPEGWQARARTDALRELRSAREAARRELAL